MIKLLCNIIALPMCLLLLLGSGGASLYVHTCSAQHHVVGVSLIKGSMPCTSGAQQHQCCQHQCSHDTYSPPLPHGISPQPCCQDSAISILLSQFEAQSSPKVPVQHAAIAACSPFHDGLQPLPVPKHCQRRMPAIVHSPNIILPLRL